MKTPSDIVVTVEELKKDPRTIQAEQRLKDAGFSESWWESLLARVLELPRRHEAVMRETMPEATRRREKLAAEMNVLAVKLDQDPEVSGYFPTYGGVRQQQPMLNRFRAHQDALSLSEWLEACGETLVAGSSFDIVSRPMDSRRGADLETFVIRGVFYWIERYLRAGRTKSLNMVRTTRARNLETALLAGAILRKSISSNRVVRLREKERRQYHKE